MAGTTYGVHYDITLPVLPGVTITNAELRIVRANAIGVPGTLIPYPTCHRLGRIHRGEVASGHSRRFVSHGYRCRAAVCGWSDWVKWYE